MIVKFPYNACRRVHSRKPRISKNGTPEERAAKAAAQSTAAPVIEISRRGVVAAESSADPVYAAIERHRKAAREHLEAVRIQFAFEEAGSIKGERREEYERLEAATDIAYDAMDEAACALVNAKPTTLAGILALCRYIGPLFEGDDSPDLPEYISYDDDTQATSAEALCHAIGAAVEDLMKAAT